MNVDYERLLLSPRSNRNYLKWIALILLVGLAIGFVGVLAVMSPVLLRKFGLSNYPNHGCFNNQCKLVLVESIPQGLVYNSTVKNLQTFQAWKELLKNVNNKLEIASSYWSLRGKDVYQDKSDWQGEEIYQDLVKAAQKGIQIDITQNLQKNPDTEDLSKIRGIRVKSLNFTALMGNGILHTKLWIADRKHFYVGSANFDWRSLTQVKEMGVLAIDCPCLAKDMGKIWDVYWQLGGAGKHVPDNWPESYNTDINAKKPLKVHNIIDNSQLDIFLSSSPPPFCPIGREIDIDAIVRVMDEADKFIHFAVMDYFPQTIYSKDKLFWPVIDNAIRRAAIQRGVKVKILLSKWTHTRSDMRKYLKSLIDLNGLDKGRVSIEGKFFTVPSFNPEQALIPFARVNHNKYLVTDKTGYIGTSNWSADYFINTGGIGFVFDSNKNQHVNDLRYDLNEVFLRDWNSSYASYKLF